MSTIKVRQGAMVIHKRSHRVGSVVYVEQLPSGKASAKIWVRYRNKDKLVEGDAVDFDYHVNINGRKRQKTSIDNDCQNAEEDDKSDKAESVKVKGEDDCQNAEEDDKSDKADDVKEEIGNNNKVKMQLELIKAEKRIKSVCEGIGVIPSLTEKLINKKKECIRIKYDGKMYADNFIEYGDALIKANKEYDLLKEGLCKLIYNTL